MDKLINWLLCQCASDVMGKLLLECLGESRTELGTGQSGKDHSLCPCRYCCPVSSQTAKIQDAKVVRIDKILKE